MKDQIVMSKATGDVAIAVPLYRWNEHEELDSLEGYSVFLGRGKPIAYIVDMGSGNCPLVNAKTVESQLEFLGDL